MTAVFSHGRLRLYLLKLLAEGPKHGYELIRLLENRFLGLYAPSAGTIYPRLAKLEAEGLVTHASAGGRKTYEITAAGLAELTARRGELAALESEIHASVADLSTLATDIEREVSGSVRDIKRELGEASRVSRDARSGRPNRGGREWAGRDWAGRDWAAWGREQHERKTAGSGPGAGDAVIADLEQAVSDLASEVRRLARRAGVGDPDVVAATAVVVSALTELRRLLRK